METKINPPRNNCGERSHGPSCELKDGEKDWKHRCIVCGRKPTVHPTDLWRAVLLRRSGDDEW